MSARARSVALAGLVMSLVFGVAVPVSASGPVFAAATVEGTDAAPEATASPDTAPEPEASATPEATPEHEAPMTPEATPEPEVPPAPDATPTSDTADDAEPLRMTGFGVTSFDLEEPHLAIGSSRSKPLKATSCARNRLRCPSQHRARPSRSRTPRTPAGSCCR